MVEIILGIIIFLVLLSLGFIVIILTQKRRHRKKDKRVKLARDYLFKHYIDNKALKLPVSKKFFLEALIDVDEQIHLDPVIRERIIEDLLDSKFVKRQTKKLNSFFAYKRKMAVFYLGRLRMEETYAYLYNQFVKEKDESVKLKIVSELRYGLNEERLKAIIESLNGSTDSYHQRLCTLLGNNYKRLYQTFNQYKNDQRYPVVLGLVRIASFHADAFLSDYMLEKLKWLLKDRPYQPIQNNLLIQKIARNLREHTPELLINYTYLNHENDDIREQAILALAVKPKLDYIKAIIRNIDGSHLDNIRIQTLSKVVLKEKKYLFVLLDLISEATPIQRRALGIVVAERIDYLLLRRHEINEEVMALLFEIIINENIVEPLIDFLNINKNKELESYIIHLLKPKLISSNEALKQLQLYLTPQILEKLALKPVQVKELPKEKAPLEKKKLYWIIRWIFISILIFPIIFIIRHIDELFTMSFRTIFERFLIEANIYLIFYFVMINIIYLLLFFLSFIASKKHVNLARTKKHSLLFSNRLLPGISIIAPAYNEGLSIIESVSSLLNLKYPTYEVVVVNDGSKDDTLMKLIEAFKLERVYDQTTIKINTKPVRGVYKTAAIPNLVVVDKQNGGKADALNVGINIANQPFVCGIDADSILEGEALLKLASAMLEDNKPFVAMGGNIYPANGFTFDHGSVTKKAIPKESICRFQTVEYLRAFTSGRIGWSALKSLMIISGAFGMFQRQALIETGGYLTSSGSFKKDTVGEDMELVVRLTKQALEKKDPYRVSYVYNAYCYTELPSDLNTLLKQRNRWQRGLIDILVFHKNISFNPKYKQIGLIGYPYFFIFEFLGPFIELQGYILLVIALILGLLNPVIILGIFTASILMGVVISLSSLYMAEREVQMMSKKETFLLILFAILENFGYRQMISMHRVISSIKAVKESGKWGAQKRKGFKSDKT